MSLYRTVPAKRTEAQRQASKENYMLFQISGAIGNLQSLLTKRNLPESQDEFMQAAISSIHKATFSLSLAKRNIKNSQIARSKQK